MVGAHNTTDATGITVRQKLTTQHRPNRPSVGGYLGEGTAPGAKPTGIFDDAPATGKDAT